MRRSLLFVLASFSCLHAAAAETPRMHIQPDAGRLLILEDKAPVLVLNHDVVAPPPGKLEKIAPGNRKYAQPRSGYIHPLYGPSGEELTFDWSPDHPHHRGIYWAWPEVTWNGEMRDLHALQGVFARPEGDAKTTEGADDATITSTSLWKWSDKTPIVRETVTLRAERAGPHGRRIDLTLTLEALEDGITIARRQAKLYGGLNTRLGPAKGLALTHHADAPGKTPLMAWHRASGTWGAATNATAITLFEKSANPGYPADHIEYPELPWFQPTFPKEGQRHALKKGEPLTLRYRYWIRGGAAADEAATRAEWLQFNEPQPGTAP